MPAKPKLFYVSASALNSFYSCMAQWDFGRRLEPLFKDNFLEDGSAAHAMMEGKVPTKFSIRARSFYEQLIALYEERGYTPLWVEDGKPKAEVRQVVTLNKNLRLVRVIDAFAKTKEGEPVLLDWKTAVWPWRPITLPGVKPLPDLNPVPQSMGFQAAAYLITPDDPKSVPFEWPTRIDFLVASEKGGMDVHTYRWNDEGEVNLLNAADAMQAWVKGKMPLPKHRSSGCGFCSFAPACYELPGWEALYKEKEHGNKENKR